MRIPVIIGLSLALASCATHDIQLSSRQGMILAEAGADGVNHAAVVATHAGLHGSDALRAKAAVDGVNIAVEAAHDAKAKGAPDVDSIVKNTLALIANAYTVIQGATPASAK